MPDDERIEQLELQNKVLQANNKGLKDTIDELREELNKEKEKNEKLEKQMGKDLDVVYLKGVYDQRSKWQDKIKAKIERIEATGLSVCNEQLNYQMKLEDAAKIQVLQELLQE